MRPALAAAALLTLLSACPAAPLPRDTLSDQYLPDDTDFVIVVNVKRLVASPLFARAFRKPAEGALARGPVAGLLQGAGLDPLKDVSRVLIFTGGGSWPEESEVREAGPSLLVQGSFDLARLHAQADRAARDYPAVVTAHARRDAKVYEIALGPDRLLAVALDAHTLFASPQPDAIDAALAKAAGKKKTELKNAELRERFARPKADRALAVIGTADMVTATSDVTEFKDGKTVYKRTARQTLGEEGMRLLTLDADVGDELSFRLTLVCKDADQAAKGEEALARLIKAGITRMGADERTAALAEALRGLKLSRRGDVLTLEGKADADAVRQLVTLRLFGFGGSVAPPAPTGKPER
jgi:hypothetical protein